MDHTDRSHCNQIRVWLADLTYTQQTISVEAMPQAIGGIATYAEQYVGLPNRIRLFKFPETIVDALEANRPPHVIGFSNYVWNSCLSREFARVIKNISPDTIVVFGGPQYPVLAEEQEEYLRDLSDVDFYIDREGEIAFAQLLERLIDERFDTSTVHGTVGAVHSIDSQTGKVHLPPALHRIQDLTDIPSPYLDGRLDEFIDGRLIPTIQTNRGCPFGCKFCLEGVSYYNKVYKKSRERISAELHYLGSRMKQLRDKGGRNDLLITDSNFGMFKDDVHTCEAIAECQARYGWPEHINVTTGKNQKARILSATKLVNGAIQLSGSVQSLDTGVLQNVNRSNISEDQIMQLALSAAETGSEAYSEVILCLPGDSRTKHYDTIRKLIDGGFDRINIFQFMLLPGSELCTRANREKYGMVTGYRVVPRSYGTFEVCGHTIIAAEIDEVCIANNTMSYEDYVDCREMNLLVVSFYNDGVFRAVVKFLRMKGISVFRWIELIKSGMKGTGLERLLQEFRHEFDKLLWNRRSDLQRFVVADGNIERFIRGELGNNLLYTYRIRLLSEALDDMLVVGRKALDEMCMEAGGGTTNDAQFLDDVFKFQHARVVNLLVNDPKKNMAVVMTYDVAGFLEAPLNTPIEDFRLPCPMKVEFVLGDDQYELLMRYHKIFGNEPWSIGRILSKLRVSRLFRQPLPHKNGNEDEDNMEPLKYVSTVM